jgi:hypothetical protein
MKRSMQRNVVTSKLHITHWFLLALAGAAYASGCGDSEKGTPGSGGKAGAAGSSAAGKGGGSGSAGRSGTAGKGGTSGGGGGRGGSAGKGGTGSGGDAGDPGSGGDAGDPGSGGRAGGSAGTGVQAGQAGEGGEGGASSAVSGATCLEIHLDEPTAPTGVYSIDPDGAGGDPPVSVVCDMTTQDGGWTLGLIKNSVHNGNYEDFASGRVTPEALATTPEAASAMTGAVATAGWIDLNDFPYTDLELAGYRNGVETYRSEPIPKTELRLPFGTDGYYLYDQVDGYYWCGGTNAYTTNGVGQVMKPTGAPDDCKGHTSLGNGWDFGTTGANAGLTVCGGGSSLMTSHPSSGYIYYGGPGAAQAFWVR